MDDRCIITLVGMKPVDIYSDEPVHVNIWKCCEVDIL